MSNKDILSRYNISSTLYRDSNKYALSVNSGSSIAEARVEKGLPFRIREKWATIGDENRPWHIHLNMKEVVQVRFVKDNACEFHKNV